MRSHVRFVWLIAALAGCTATTVDEAVPQESALASSMLVKNYRAVRDDRATALRVEHWTFLSLEECERRGLADSCAKVCSAPDSRSATGTECNYRSFNRAVLDPARFETGYFCTEERCVAASAALRNPSVLQLYEPRAGGNAYDVDVTGGHAMTVVGVIPPFIYDWLTGGVCCDDCWAMHRSWGLACEVDYACCFGTCGIQPGCGGGGGGGGTGGGGGGGDGGDTGGTDGDSCGASYQTEGASVTYMGQSCSFDGEVNPTWIDGECVPVAGEGLIYDCVGDTGGGIDYTPPETEDTGIGL